MSVPPGMPGTPGTPGSTSDGDGSGVAPWLLPVIAWQGLRVRRTTVVLPEAGGPRTGLVAAPDRASDLPSSAQTTGAAAGPFQLLVLGESTAAGVGAQTHAEALTGHLAALLAESTRQPVQWTVVARSGATLQRIRHRLLPEVVAVPGGYDLVVLLAGVNDVLTRRAPAGWAQDIEAVRDGLLPLLAPRGRVVLTGVPSFLDFPSLPRPLSAYLDQHGRSLDARTAALAGDRVLWVSSREVMAVPAEQPGSGAGDAAADAGAHPAHATGERATADWFAADGFHPGPQGYAVWARALAARL
jgi:lysophospholipase L1-like esterase